VKRLAKEILEVIRDNPNGLSISAIHGALVQEVSKRSVQRIISELMLQGSILREGKGPGTKYVLGAMEDTHLGEKKAQAVEIKSYLHQPLSARKKVAYNFDFLNAYRPNKDFYLDETTREHLESLGSQPDGEHPQGTFAKIVFLVDFCWIWLGTLVDSKGILILFLKPNGCYCINN